MGNFLLIIPNFKDISPISDHLQKINSRGSKFFFPMCISKNLLLENYLNLPSTQVLKLHTASKLEDILMHLYMLGIRYKKF